MDKGKFDEKKTRRERQRERETGSGKDFFLTGMEKTMAEML